MSEGVVGVEGESMSDWGSLWGMVTEDSKVFLAAVGGTLAVLVFQRLVDWAVSGLRVLRRSRWGHKPLRWQLFQNGFGNVWIYLYNPSSVTFEFCHVTGCWSEYMLEGVHGIRKLSPGERVLVLAGRPNFEEGVTTNRSVSFRSFKRRRVVVLMDFIRKYFWRSNSFDGWLSLGSSVPFKSYYVWMNLRCSGGSMVWESHLSSLDSSVGVKMNGETFESKSGETVRLIKPKPESDV